MRKAAFFMLVAAVFIAGYALHWMLPREAVVTVSGAMSKRAEATPGRGAEASADGADVFYVTAEMNGKSVVFRNEDTNWGMPPYFKFDAAETQALAQSLAGTECLVRYYGWRNRFFGMFPNIVSLEKADGASPSTPAFRVLAYLFLAGVFAYLAGLVAKMREEKPKGRLYA